MTQQQRSSAVGEEAVLAGCQVEGSHSAAAMSAGKQRIANGGGGVGWWQDGWWRNKERKKRKVKEKLKRLEAAEESMSLRSRQGQC